MQAAILSGEISGVEYDKKKWSFIHFLQPA